MIHVAHPVLKGWHQVAAWWLPAEWLDDPTRQQRLLQLWQAGDVVYRFNRGDLLLKSQLQPVNTQEVQGWPLQRRGVTLCSAEISSEQVRTLPQADVWLALGAELHALHWRDASVLDLSQSLDVSVYGLLDTYDLELEPIPDVVLTESMEDVRSILGNKVRSLSPEQLAIMQALRSKKINGAMSPNARKSRQLLKMPLSWWLVIALIGLFGVIFIGVLNGLSDASTTTTTTTPHATAVGGSGSWWLLIPFALLVLRLLIPFFGKAIKTPISSIAIPKSAPASRPLINERRKRQKLLPQKWRDYLARLANFTQMSRLLGHQHAQYIQRMMAMFESGDLLEALHHAIPLGEDGDTVGQGFGRLGPRDALALDNVGGVATSISLASHAEQHLRQLYRRAFEKLDQQGCIEEAAYILAKLLGSQQEALDYLERKGRIAQAAELALKWDLSPAIVVRLLCLAGDWRRAVAVARRDNAFAEALQGLEQNWPNIAQDLRLAWGHTLAEQGDPLGAVEVLRPIEAFRVQALKWLDQAERVQGGLGARALVQRAVWLPDTLEAYTATITNLRDDPALFIERQALAKEALRLNGQHKGLNRLLQPLVGQLLADQVHGRGKLLPPDMKRLLDHAGHKLLSADLPNAMLPTTPIIGLKDQPTPLRLHIPLGTGSAILDAVVITDGNYLLALGESGACVVNRHGHVLTRFAAPAHSIVISYNQNIALLLAKREKVCRISRLDLVTAKVRDLGSRTLDSLNEFAKTFDGIAWTIAAPDRVQVLDVSQGLNEVLWQVADLPGTVCNLSVTERIEQWLLKSPNDLQYWCYQLPQRRLINRDSLEIGNTKRPMLNETAGGVLEVNDDCKAIYGAWQLMADTSTPSTQYLQHSNPQKVHAYIHQCSSSPRVQGADWLWFSESGQLLHLNVTTSQVVQLGLR
jgi:hypothetical protein